MIFLSSAFQLAANFEYCFDQSGEIQIENTYLSEIKNETIFNALLKTEYQDEFTSVRSFIYHRKNDSPVHKLENLINPNKILIFTFPNYMTSQLRLVNKNHLKTARDILNESQAIFTLNTCFYDPENNPTGKLTLNGTVIQRGISDIKTGYLNICHNHLIITHQPEPTAESICQGKPMIIRNSRLLTMEEDKHFFRNTIGTDHHNNIVCIVSNNGALLTKKETAEIACKLGLKNACMFDGGIALQYMFKNGDFELEFAAGNNKIDLGRTLDEFFMRKTRMNLFQRSPVYLTISQPKP